MTPIELRKIEGSVPWHIATWRLAWAIPTTTAIALTAACIYCVWGSPTACRFLDEALR